MKFEEALKAMREGKKVNCYLVDKCIENLHIKRGNLYADDFRVEHPILINPSQDFILAEDWEVVEE